MTGRARKTGDAAAFSMPQTVVAALLVIALAAASFHRNSAWHSLLALWEDCARKSPEKSRTRNNLGNCNLLLNRHFPAIAEYQKAVQLDPRNLEAQYNLATTLDTVGLFSQAMPPYEVFCREAPSVYAEQKAAACRRLRELLAAAGERKTP